MQYNGMNIIHTSIAWTHVVITMAMITKKIEVISDTYTYACTHPDVSIHCIDTNKWQRPIINHGDIEPLHKQVATILYNIIMCTVHISVHIPKFSLS